MATSPAPLRRPRPPLSERAQLLFKLLVERYICEGQPVGSRTLARDAKLDLSPATVRNVMADLEDMGLLRSPHTSAGRVPTAQGFRLFVDCMMTVREPTAEEVQRVAQDLMNEDGVRRLIERASSVLSEITRLASIVTLPRVECLALRHVEFLPLNDNRVLCILIVNEGEVQNRIIHTARRYASAELEQAANYLNEAFVGKDLKEVRADLLSDLARTRAEMDRMMQAVIEMAEKALLVEAPQEDYVVSGQTNLMAIEDLSDVEKLRQIFEAFNRKRDILHLLDQAVSAQGVQIFIGEESGYEVLNDYSVVTSTYGSDGRVLGVLGVVGPTRMAYERVVPIVDLTARLLGAALKSLG